MSEYPIRVERLGKRYRLGERRPMYGTLRETLQDSLRSPLRRWRERRATKELDEIWALQDVTFDVRRGQVLAIIGRNGAGKSTLLKILSRVVGPTSGRAWIRGRVGSLLEVGTGFHAELTGRENVYLNGAILGMTRPEIDRKFDTIVEFAELERFLDTPVKRYSTGMYMRLAFAVAAHLEPDILLVDEVLAVGDAAFQKKCLGKIGEVAREGRTVLFVSHNLAAVQRLCDSALLLERGRLAARGTVSDVLQAYLRDAATPLLDWVRPVSPTGDVFFRRVYLADEAGDAVGQVTSAGQLRVVMEYVVRRTCRGLQVSVDLLDEHGDLIFASNPQDVGVESPEAAGRYCATVSMPQQILLAKTYGVRTNLWVPWDGMLDCVDSLRFSVQELASMGNSIPEGKPGKIVIPCTWQIEPSVVEVDA